ncbi:MAG TPA: hypothetical protein VE953_23810 [Terriglobales bacterium]|nr:hypothetical protein [Terriglobales bacterium]
MKWRGWLLVLVLGPGVSVVLGVAFFVIAAHESAAADAYRAAQPCQQASADPANCFELSDAVIRSVHVSQTRTGEQDDVVLATPTGSLTATLAPSSADSQHVRSGAAAIAKIYRGKVTAVAVDDRTVPSAENPAADQSQWRFYGLWFVGVGLASSLVIPVWRRVGRSARARDGSPPPPPQLQLEVVPGGGIGTVLAPRVTRSVWLQLGFAAGLLLLTTARWLLVPALTSRVLVVDGVILFLGALALWLYLHNSRLFVDGNGLGRVDWLGRLTRYPSGSIVRANRYSVANRYRRNAYLAFVGPDGREVFKVVASAYWDRAQLEALCERARLPVEGTYRDVVTVSAMNRRVPGSLNWARSIAITAVVVLVIIGLVLLFDGPTTR